ncbi:MAG: hypothetical protein QXX08_10545 [Candidatus Bathyarchaeia archaeon]
MNSGRKVTPLQLYKASPTQRFMRKCNNVGVEWVIFSDKHGFVFSQDQIEWYEKHPNTVTHLEKEKLFGNALAALRPYDYVYFYYNPCRIHPFYRALISELRRNGKEVAEITHLSQIQKR